jgi:hypothetical protein
MREEKGGGKVGGRFPVASLGFSGGRMGLGLAGPFGPGRWGVLPPIFYKPFFSS